MEKSKSEKTPRVKKTKKNKNKNTAQRGKK